MSAREAQLPDRFEEGRAAGLAEAREYLRNWLDESLDAFSDAVDNLAELSGEGRFASAATKDGGGSSGPGTDEGDVYALVKAATKTLEMLDAVGYEDQYHGKGELREALAPFRAPVENGGEATSPIPGGGEACAPHIESALLDRIEEKVKEHYGRWDDIDRNSLQAVLAILTEIREGAGE